MTPTDRAIRPAERLGRVNTAPAPVGPAAAQCSAMQAFYRAVRNGGSTPAPKTPEVTL